MDVPDFEERLAERLTTPLGATSRRRRTGPADVRPVRARAGMAALVRRARRAGLRPRCSPTRGATSTRATAGTGCSTPSSSPARSACASPSRDLPAHAGPARRQAGGGVRRRPEGQRARGRRARLGRHPPPSYDQTAASSKPSSASRCAARGGRKMFASPERHRRRVAGQASRMIFTRWGQRGGQDPNSSEQPADGVGDHQHEQGDLPERPRGRAGTGVPRGRARGSRRARDRGRQR